MEATAGYASAAPGGQHDAPCHASAYSMPDSIGVVNGGAASPSAATTATTATPQAAPPSSPQVHVVTLQQVQQLYGDQAVIQLLLQQLQQLLQQQQQQQQAQSAAAVSSIIWQHPMSCQLYQAPLAAQPQAAAQYVATPPPANLSASSTPGAPAAAIPTPGYPHTFQQAAAAAPAAMPAAVPEQPPPPTTPPHGFTANHVKVSPQAPTSGPPTAAPGPVWQAPGGVAPTTGTPQAYGYPTQVTATQVGAYPHSSGAPPAAFHAAASPYPYGSSGVPMAPRPPTDGSEAQAKSPELPTPGFFGSAGGSDEGGPASGMSRSGTPGRATPTGACDAGPLRGRQRSSSALARRREEGRRSASTSGRRRASRSRSVSRMRHGDGAGGRSAEEGSERRAVERQGGNRDSGVCHDGCRGRSPSRRYDAAARRRSPALLCGDAGGSKYGSRGRSPAAEGARGRQRQHGGEERVDNQWGRRSVDEVPTDLESLRRCLDGKGQRRLEELERLLPRELEEEVLPEVLRRWPNSREPIKMFMATARDTLQRAGHCPIGGGPGNGGGGGGGGLPPAAGVVSEHDVRALKAALDPSAKDDLEELEREDPDKARRFISETAPMYKRGQLKNPSRYVTKSCFNLRIMRNTKVQG